MEFKKFFAVVLLAVGVIFVEQDKTFAADYYIGTYSDGRDCYLMTETISKHFGADDLTVYECRVKAVILTQATLFTLIMHFGLTQCRIS